MNTYKNWHRPAKWYRAKERELSSIFGFRALKKNTGFEISVHNDEGDRMAFLITRESAQLLYEQLQRELNKP